MNSDQTPTMPDGVVPPEPTPTAPETPAAPRRRSPARPVLIGAAAGAAVLLIGGVGLGAIAALNDGRDVPLVPAAEVSDAATPTEIVRPSDDAAQQKDAERRTREEIESRERAEEARIEQEAAGQPTALVAAIDRAVAAAQGTGASSVEVEFYGWSVDVILPDGSEVDVRVMRDGTTTVRADHRDDDADPAIDTDRVADIVAAALAAVGSGSVTSIETDDASRYDVSVASESGAEIDVELAADLTVIDIDRD